MRVRPAVPRDLKACRALDHAYMTDHVWQMEMHEEGQGWSVAFRVAPLPREVCVDYPRQGEDLETGWQHRDAFLIAEEGRVVCGYVALAVEVEHKIARIEDLVVDQSRRRHGIGTMLLRAAAQWAKEHELTRLSMAVQTKNYPAIKFCQARGLSFYGYNDHYWKNQDIALFFGESLR